MSSRRIWSLLPRLLTGLVLSLLTAFAWMLRSARLGRLLSTVSLPRLYEHRLRTTLTVLGIALGVAMLVAVLIVNESVVRGVSSTVQDLAGETDLQISAGASGFSEALLEEVREVSGVARAVPILQQTVSVRDGKARGERILLLGVDMLSEDDAYLRDYGSAELDAIRRDPLEFLNSTHNILLSEELATRCGFQLHDTISLSTSEGVQPFEIWGFVDARKGVGSAFGGAVGVMYYQAMQAAFARGENVDRIDVALEAGAELARVQDALRTRLGSGFVVERPARKGERIGRMLFGVQSGLTMASLIALLVGAFLIHNTMSISVVQRTSEIGILRALGTRRREIVALLTLEGALLGSVGSLLGVAIGVALSKVLLGLTTDALNQTYLEVGAAQVTLRPGVLVAGLALGSLSATVAAALPARRAAHQPPAHTLRTSAIVSTEPSGARANARDLLGVVLLLCAWPLLELPAWQGVAVGALLAVTTLLAACTALLPRWVQLAEWSGVGLLQRFMSVEARLASENLPRDVGRTAMTAGALMAGVALAVGFGTFTHSFTTSLTQWIYQTLPGDLFITQSASMGGTSSRNMPMEAAFFSELAALPEVESIRRTRIVDLPFRGYNVKAVSTDVSVYAKHARLSLLEGEVADVLDALRAGDIAVSENFSRHFDVHAGDTIELAMQRGTRSFRVSGVYLDYTSDVGTVLMSRERYVEMFRDDRVDTYELYLHDATTAQAVRRKVYALAGEDRDLNVLTSAEFRAAIRQTTSGIFGLVRALELVALIVAVLGIINTQYANVLDRSRELAVLRALGMLRKQLKRMVVIEAALVGAVGSLAGVVLGLAFGKILLSHINLVQTGWYFPFRVSFGSIAEATGLTIVAAALAGLYPAAEAARLNIAESLASE